MNNKNLQNLKISSAASLKEWKMSSMKCVSDNLCAQYNLLQSKNTKQARFFQEQLFEWLNLAPISRPMSESADGAQIDTHFSLFPHIMSTRKRQIFRKAIEIRKRRKREREMFGCHCVSTLRLIFCFCAAQFFSLFARKLDCTLDRSSLALLSNIFWRSAIANVKTNDTQRRA